MKAALGSPIGVQPLMRYLIAALDAAAIRAGGDSLQCSIDRANFAEIPTDGRVIRVDQRRSDRFVTRVGDLARELAKRLVFDTAGIRAFESGISIMLG